MRPATRLRGGRARTLILVDDRRGDYLRHLTRPMRRALAVTLLLGAVNAAALGWFAAGGDQRVADPLGFSLAALANVVCWQALAIRRVKREAASRSAGE